MANEQTNAGHLKALESVVKFDWNSDEYWDDAIWRGAVVGALKLALLREYPIIRHVRLIQVLCFAWVELRAFIDYERGKFFVNYGKRALAKFGCSKIFM